MPPDPYDGPTTEKSLAQCLLIFARRGAQVRAELRAQYGLAEGDQRMSELAREAERTLWPDKAATPTATLTREKVGLVNASNDEALEHSTHSPPC